MRHATVNATYVFYHWFDKDDTRASHGNRRACDWALDNKAGLEQFHEDTAYMLLDGKTVELPTCPACAALIDLAVELGGK